MSNAETWTESGAIWDCMREVALDAAGAHDWSDRGQLGDGDVNGQLEASRPFVDRLERALRNECGRLQVYRIAHGNLAQIGAADPTLPFHDEHYEPTECDMERIVQCESVEIELLGAVALALDDLRESRKAGGK